MAGNGRVVGMGGGFWRGGQLQGLSSAICVVELLACALSAIVADSHDGKDL